MSIPIRPRLYRHGVHVKIPFKNERLGIDRLDDFLPMTVSYGATAETALNSAISYANELNIDFDEIEIEFGHSVIIKHLDTGLLKIGKRVL